MYYPEVAEDNNTRSMIDTWLGYNHNYRIGSGEFYDMENLSTDAFPVMSPRKTRKLVHAISKKTVESAVDITVTYSYCDEEGNDIPAEASDVPPLSPGDGLYWLNTDDKKMYRWSADDEEWKLVVITYIKINVPGAKFNETFAKGNKVNMNTGFEEMDVSSTLEKVQGDYIVVQGSIYDVVGKPVLIKEVETTVFWKLKVVEDRAGYRGILYVGSSLAFLDGDIFHYSGWELDISQFLKDEDKGGSDEQTLLEFGSYVLIYPLNIYINLDRPFNDSGRMTSEYEAPINTVITYTMCDINGNDYENVTISDTAPASPKNGDYWLCTREYSEGLNMWYATSKSWTPVATTYIRIAIPGANFKSKFKVDDALSMNTYLHDINSGSQIKAIDDEYIVVIGLVYNQDPNPKPVMQHTQTTSDAWTLKMMQRLPKLDYVCTHKNRVWGCGYGYDQDRNFVNEIYCTKLGDFSSWYTYAGISTDSYAVTVGAPGAWTGCISYGGYPTFFKNDKIFRVFGSFPSEFMLDQIDARGVEYGSHKSLAILGEQLYYKASSGVMVFDGSLPVMISTQFGRDTEYSNGVAGANDNKYHIVLMNERGSYTYFVYDSEYGLWTKENSLNAVYFSGSVNGSMYACTSDGIYQVGIRTLEDTQSTLLYEEYVEWYGTTGDMGYEYPDFKYVSRLTLRAFVPRMSEIQVQIAYDDGEFEDVGVLRGKDEVMTQTLTINPFRCDHFKLRFKGHGNVRIYSLATTLETGSEDYEYKN